MDARSIAVQTYLLQYLRKNGALVKKDSKRGGLIFVQRKDGVAVEIAVRDLATFLADKMA